MLKCRDIFILKKKKKEGKEQKKVRVVYLKLNLTGHPVFSKVNLVNLTLIVSEPQVSKPKIHLLNVL